MKANFFVALCSKLFHVRPVTQGDVYRAETEEIPRIFQVAGSFLFSLDFLNSHSALSAFTSDIKMSDGIFCWASNVYFKTEFLTECSAFVSVFRFCMPTRGSAGRRQTWRRSLRATRPTVSHTKATSSSPRYITSLPIVRPAPNLCGTSSSHLQPLSVAAATSSATRTTLTKRRMLLLLAKVIYLSCSLVYIGIKN